MQTDGRTDGQTDAEKGKRASGVWRRRTPLWAGELCPLSLSVRPRQEMGRNENKTATLLARLRPIRAGLAETPEKKLQLLPIRRG